MNAISCTETLNPKTSFWRTRSSQSSLRILASRRSSVKNRSQPLSAEHPAVSSLPISSPPFILMVRRRRARDPREQQTPQVHPRRRRLVARRSPLHLPLRLPALLRRAQHPRTPLQPVSADQDGSLRLPLPILGQCWRSSTRPH